MKIVEDIESKLGCIGVKADWKVRYSETFLGWITPVPKTGSTKISNKPWREVFVSKSLI